MLFSLWTWRESNPQPPVLAPHQFIFGLREIRTPDLLYAKQALCRLSYEPMKLVRGEQNRRSAIELQALK